MNNSNLKKIILCIILAITAGVFLCSGEALARKTTTISGCITDAVTGAPIQGVRFYVVDPLGQYKTLEQIKQEYDNARNKDMSSGASGQLQTDAQGYYNFQIWDWRDTYQNTYGLVPFHSNYGFDPVYTTFDLGIQDRNYTFDFTGKYTPLYTISGKLKYDDGTPIGGKDVTVCVCSPDNKINPDKVTGEFKQNKLPTFDEWWVAVPAEFDWENPKPEGLEEGEYEWNSQPIQFETEGEQFNILTIFTTDHDITDLVFTAKTHSIEGYVKDYSKKPEEEGIGDVTIRYKSTSCRGVPVGIEGKVTTEKDGDNKGRYRIEKLYNGTYTITAEKAGYVFDPSSYDDIVIERGDSNVNFYTYGISGRVTRHGTGEGLSGLNVTLKDKYTSELIDTVQTKPDGSYEIKNLRGGTYIVEVEPAIQ